MHTIPAPQPALTPTGTATANVSVHPRGFGFANCDDGTDAFIPPPLLEAHLDGDRVEVDYLVEIRDGEPRRTATATRLISRDRTELFGTVERAGGRRVLRGDPHTTNTTWPLDGDAADGEAVTATTTDGATFTVTSRHGDLRSPEALWAMTLCRHRIDAGPGPAAEAEAAQIAARPVTGAPTGRRRDLRDLHTFTIDADHSMDLDDALSAGAADHTGAITVWVHIADVAEVLVPGSALDDAARTAATSTYLPGRVRPMLPKVLSEGALSLNPGVERDTLTVEMRVAPDGTVRAADIYESRIRSNGRLSYDTVTELLTRNTAEGVDEDCIETVAWLRTAAARIGCARARRGGLSAGRVEPELAVGVEAGSVTVRDAEANTIGHQLIERLMVAANETVAEWLTRRGAPTMYRTHAAPGADAATELELYAAHLGFRCGFGGTIDAHSLAALEAQLEAADGVEVRAVWERVMRHLGRATYTGEAGGHFGLGSELYAHFTSPIRRYADVSVHRAVKATLAGARGDELAAAAGDLDELAAHINAAAGTATRAERDCTEAMWLVALDTPAERNRERRGRVVSINDRGCFVAFDDTGISGFCAWRDLDGGRWDADADHLRARSNSGAVIELGDEVTVTISHLDVAAGSLELASAGRGARNRGGSGRHRGQHGRGGQRRGSSGGARNRAGGRPTSN